MTQRTAFIITFMVTAFVLVTVGGVTATIANHPVTPAQEALVVTDPPTPTPDIGVDPAVVAERDAQYQQALEQANKQLQQAYFLQKALADELANPPATATPKPRVFVQVAPTATAAPAYPISPEQAMSLALNAAPGATVLGVPELVLFAGVPAYEVNLDWGKVYIDATTGAVLYNGAPAPSSNISGGNNNDAPQPQQQASAGGNNHENESEHHESEHSEHEGGDD